VYVASLPIDELRDDAAVDPDAFASATQRPIAACNALDRDDPVLAAVRRTCPLAVQLREQLLRFGACAGGDRGRCLDVIGDLQRTIAAFERRGRRADRAIARAGLTPACQDALTTPPLAYEVFDGYARALALFERGLATGSAAGVEKAQRVLTQSAAEGRELPDGRRSLTLFRSGCA